MDELQAVLALIYVTIFLDIDPVKSFPLRQAAKTVARQLSEVIEKSISPAGGWLSGIFGGGSGQRNGPPLSPYGTDLIKSLSRSGMSPSEIVSSQVLPAIVAMVPAQSTVVCCFFA